MSDFPGKRILVADDDPVIVDFLQRLLTNLGCSVVTAQCGREAIELARATNPDLALLDYRMPDLTGIETARTLQCLFGVRSVIMSIYTDRDLVMEAADEGALGYIIKPLKVDDVLNTLHLQLKRAAELKSYQTSQREQAEHMTRAIVTARKVNTAVGVLMERQKISRDTAQKSLIATARRSRKALEIVADELLTTSEAAYAVLSGDRESKS